MDGGQTVIYTLFADPTLMRLMRLKIAEAKPEPLNKEATKSEFEPAVSNDGRMLAFVQLRGSLSLGLEIRDLDTNRRSEVPPGEGFSGMRSPAISPDRSQVVYALPHDGRQKLYIVSSQGGSPRMLTDGQGIDNWPSFSPDGRQIVFSSSRDRNFELYLVDSEGKDLRRLTDHPRQDIRPAFSPDGKRIAFTSHRDGVARVYVMNADGTSVQGVKPVGDRDDFPTWHPDGRRLVLVSERGGGHDLYVVDAP